MMGKRRHGDDPRGLGRSTRRDDGVDNVPTVQANDVHALIQALGAGPVEMFASSGGAVTGLALVAAPLDASLHARLQLAYAVMALAGWLGLTTLGQLYKIMPFLVWSHRFAPKMGRERVPLLQDMYPLRVAQVGFALLAAGLVAATCGIPADWLPAIQTGFALCTAGAAIAATNLIRVVWR